MDLEENKQPEVLVASKQTEVESKVLPVTVKPDPISLTYKPPRLFRKSLFYKTQKLFGPSKDTDGKKSKDGRSLREKLNLLINLIA